MLQHQRPTALAFSIQLQLQRLAVATNLLLLCAAFQVVDVAQAMAWGALRGYRDTRIPMYLQILSYWLIGMTSAYWLGERFWGVYGYWTGICIGLGVASVLLGLRLWRTSRRAIAALPASRLSPTEIQL